MEIGCGGAIWKPPFVADYMEVKRKPTIPGSCGVTSTPEGWVKERSVCNGSLQDSISSLFFPLIDLGLNLEMDDNSCICIGIIHFNNVWPNMYSIISENVHKFWAWVEKACGPLLWRRKWCCWVASTPGVLSVGKECMQWKLAKLNFFPHKLSLEITN